MRVLTYNIRKGKGGFRHGRVVASEFGQAILKRRPDLVLCQEVFHTHEPGGPSQSHELASELGMSPAYYPNAVYNRGHHGNATISHLGIRRSFNRDLSTNRFERRGVLYAEIADGDRVLHVFNTHLGLNRRQRQAQVRVIAEIIGETCPGDAPVILAGDFNDWTGRLDQVVIEQCGLSSAVGRLTPAERRSWPNVRPLFGLDRIYYRGLALSEVRVLDVEPWTRMSDHLPVEAVFGPAS